MKRIAFFFFLAGCIFGLGFLLGVAVFDERAEAVWEDGYESGFGDGYSDKVAEIKDLVEQDARCGIYR